MDDPKTFRKGITGTFFTRSRQQILDINRQQQIRGRGEKQDSVGWRKRILLCRVIDGQHEFNIEKCFSFKLSHNKSAFNYTFRCIISLYYFLAQNQRPQPVSTLFTIITDKRLCNYILQIAEMIYIILFVVYLRFHITSDTEI